MKPKVGDLVRVVSTAGPKNNPAVVIRGILLSDLSTYYFAVPYPEGPTHPYEILSSDGNIFRDWANTWKLEFWRENESR